MKIVFGEKLNTEEEILAKEISRECGVKHDTARLLLRRNVKGVKEAKEFLNPDKKKLLNPLSLKGIKEATERIKQAKERGENVVVFGDYDADGVCATTVLVKALREYGINPRYEIPEREDGYGLNPSIIEKLDKEKKVDLVITVDCGVSDREKIKALKEKGIDVIVTDHHEPPETLPDGIVIDPKIPCDTYPFTGLCGAGVAYKLGVALIGEKADELLDYVALATVADSMDLVDENRIIVSEGLKLCNSNKIRKEFELLTGGNAKKITSQTFTYSVAPKINAGGRMGKARISLDLFLSDNEIEKYDLSVKLTELNILRQTECDEIFAQAKEIVLKENKNRNDVICVKSDNWNHGSLGIVAAKLVEEFSRPVIVFSACGEGYKGSARSTPSVNIYEAISDEKDILVAYGGHAQAAGVTVSADKFDEFERRLNASVKERSGKAKEKEIFVEWECDKPLDVDFAKEIELLEPFGIGNPRPLFAVRENEVISTPIKVGSPHYNFKTKALNMLDFNGGKDVFELSLPTEKIIVFEPNVSVFNKRTYLKGYLRTIVSERKDADVLKPYAFDNELKKMRGEGKENDLSFGDGFENVTYSDEYSALSAERTVFAEYFAVFKNAVGRDYFNAVKFCKTLTEPKNLFQAIFCLEVFGELGIFYTENGKFKFNPAVKSALTNSAIYNEIRSGKGLI